MLGGMVDTLVMVSAVVVVAAAAAAVAFPLAAFDCFSFYWWVKLYLTLSCVAHK